MDSLIGLDLGTTAVKAGVYSIEGRLLGSAVEEIPLHTPRPGWVEQDPRDWWEASLRVLRAALERASAGCSHQPAALAVSSQGISFVPVDTAGEPLCRALSWLDTRAANEAAWLEERFGAERLFALTGKRIGAVYTLPKLLWLRTHQPEVFHAADDFLMAQDFLLMRLCGVRATDYSLAGGTLLLDLHRLVWSPDLLDACGLDARRLPEPRWAGSPAGQLCRAAAEALGLPSGLKVVVGGQDQKVAALGAGLRPGWCALSLGTAAAVSCLTGTPLLDPARRIPLFPYVAAGAWDLEGVVGTAGAALHWARDALFPGLDYPAVEALARTSPPGARGVRFYPHLSGASAPHWNAAASAGFHGLSLACGREDLARAVYEGVACEIRANLDVMRELAPVEALLLFGGGSRSLLWREILSALAGLPLAALPDADAALWGASRLAGFGAGIFADPTSPAADLDFIPPSPPRVEAYQAVYQDYRAASW